jgi:hypothetical protein
MLPSALPQSISTMEAGSCVFVMGMAGEAWPMRLRQATTRRALKQESGHGLARPSVGGVGVAELEIVDVGQWVNR